MSFKFDLGEVVQDIVTGFEGVIMGRSDYFTGCNHYGLCSQTLDSDGMTKDWVWFDETRIIKVAGAKQLFAEQRTLSGLTTKIKNGLGFKATSGPMSSPPSM